MDEKRELDEYLRLVPRRDTAVEIRKSLAEFGEVEVEGGTIDGSR
jgi:hypothetical protein